MVLVLSHLTVDHAFLSRRKAVPTPPSPRSTVTTDIRTMPSLRFGVLYSTHLTHSNFLRILSYPSPVLSPRGQRATVFAVSSGALNFHVLNPPICPVISSSTKGEGGGGGGRVSLLSERVSKLKRKARGIRWSWARGPDICRSRRDENLGY